MAVKKINKYAQFVKANFHKVSRAHPNFSPQQVMSELGKRWKKK